MLDYLVTDNCSPCSDVHMPDYLGVVADMFLGASVCSHARLPSDEPLQSVLTCYMLDYLGSPQWVGGFEDPARCEPRLVQSAGCCFRLVIRTIAGVALVVCVMEQLCHT